MSFAILRHNKIKSVQKGPAIGHNHRLSKDDKANIDPTKSGLNVFFDGEGTADRIEAKLPSKRRKDAVVLIEILLTSGPEFFDAMEIDRWKLSANPNFKKWVQASIAWAKKEFGDNVVDVVLHMDESSPHLHVLTVPLTHDGRLCAKELTMRAEMQRRQTDYAKAMKQFGLERGAPAIETKRKHIGLKEAPGSGGKAEQDAKIQADLLEKSQAELVKTQIELVRFRSALAKALTEGKSDIAKAQTEAQTVLDKAEKALAESKTAMRNQQKINIDNFQLINSMNEDKKTMDQYVKTLQSELAASNEKLAVAMEEKAEAIRALVRTGAKSPAVLKTADGHHEAAEKLRGLSVMNEQAEATKAALRAQQEFDVKWAAATPANASQRALNVVDVHGRQAIYALGRGNFAVHTFQPGEVVPKLQLNEQQKGGIQR